MGPIAQLMMAATPHLVATSKTETDKLNVEPSAPGGVLENVKMILQWMKWGGLVAGVVGLIICGFMMIIGRKGRSATSVEGASGIPWILGGLTLISLATSLVGAVGVTSQAPPAQ